MRTVGVGQERSLGGNNVEGGENLKLTILDREYEVCDIRVNYFINNLR
jgi:hypothetical protein